MPGVKRILGALVALASLGGAFAGQSSVDARRLASARAAAEEAALLSRQKATDALGTWVHSLEIGAIKAASLQNFVGTLSLVGRDGVSGAAGRTLEDQLKKEPYWEPFRNEFPIYGFAIEGDDLGVVHGVKPAEMASQALVAEARKGGQASGLVLAGGRPYGAAAARIVAGALPRPAVVLLARPLDEIALGQVADRVGGALGVSDGKRLLLTSGARADAERLAAAVGSEAAGAFVADDATWAASAAPITGSLWLLAFAGAEVKAAEAARAAGTTKAIIWSAGGFIALLALVLGFRSGASAPGGGATASPSGMLAGPAEGPLPTGASGLGPEPGSGSTRPGVGGISGAGAEARNTQATPSRATSGGALETTGSTAFGDTIHMSGAVPPSVSAGRTFGRYVLIDRLGEGGMAQVFTAVVFGAEGFRRKFVVKRLRPELTSDQAVVSQFIDEANMASHLVHSNIIPVLDFGKVADEYYLATEYILGRDLGRVARRSIELDGKPLSVGVVLASVHETLKALEYAHTRTGEGGRPLGIVHRDVSPSNILLSARGEVKLFDFGIVKAAEGRVTKTQHGVVKGNVSFMAPEQARGLEVDARADLFSMGLVIYYCLTGEVLYHGDTSYELLVKAATGPGPEELARVRALPAPADAIVGKALSVDPSTRYASAAEFAAAVAPYVDRTGNELGKLMEHLFGDEFKEEEKRFAAVPAGAGGPSGPGSSQPNLRT
jgi:hypothetical protein